MARRKTIRKEAAGAVEVTEPEAEQEAPFEPTPEAPAVSSVRFKTVGRDPITLSHLRPGDLFAIESTYYKVLSPQVNGISVARVRLEAGKLVDIDEYVMGYNTLVMSVVLE